MLPPTDELLRAAGEAIVAGTAVWNWVKKRLAKRRLLAIARRCEAIMEDPSRRHFAGSSSGETVPEQGYRTLLEKDSRRSEASPQVSSKWE